MQDIKNKNYIQDFGGKVDNKDFNILETVCRELFEESNASIYYKNTKKFLSINQLKRFVSNTVKLNFGVSGKFEILDMIPRTVKWIPIKDFFDMQQNNKLHARLDNKYVLNILNKLI